MSAWVTIILQLSTKGNEISFARIASAIPCHSLSQCFAFNILMVMMRKVKSVRLEVGNLCSLRLMTHYFCHHLLIKPFTQSLQGSPLFWPLLEGWVRNMMKMQPLNSLNLNMFSFKTITLMHYGTVHQIWWFLTPQCPKMYCTFLKWYFSDRSSLFSSRLFKAFQICQIIEQPFFEGDIFLLAKLEIEFSFKATSKCRHLQ